MSLVSDSINLVSSSGCEMVHLFRQHVLRFQDKGKLQLPHKEQLQPLLSVISDRT